MVSKRVIVFGRVQGVGFRYFAQETAARHNVHGWVRNRSDGTVELHVESADRDYELFLQTLRDGNRFVGVERMEISDRPAESYRDFRIIR